MHVGVVKRCEEDDVLVGVLDHTIDVGRANEGHTGKNHTVRELLDHGLFDVDSVLDQHYGGEPISDCWPDDLLASHATIGDVLGGEYDVIVWTVCSSVSDGADDVVRFPCRKVTIGDRVDGVARARHNVVVGANHQGDVALVIKGERESGHGSDASGAYN